MPTIYAILVGINHYEGNGIENLDHANTDVEKMKNFLLNLNNGYRVNIHNGKPLLESTATKYNVTQSFKHFGQARGEDICLFYYSGHGSQIEKTPPELRSSDRGADRKLETMIMHDSRCGADDFVDKELAYLINKHTQNSAFTGKGHVVIVSDCCHSGDGARIDTVNKSGRKTKKVPALYSMPATNFVGIDNQIRCPYVQLAACGEKEEAADGVFTGEMLKVVNEANRNITYADLITSLKNGEIFPKPNIDSESTAKFFPFLGG